MSDIFQNLNDKQIEAVKHVEGPMLVIAGAGSGKTRVLTNRIAYLIQEKGVNPWNILAVTFTNKAANEMKKRIVDLVAKKKDMMFEGGFADLVDAAETTPIPGISGTPGVDYDLPTIGTFHSICVRILRKNLHLLDFENSFAIYDTADQQILMKRIMEEMTVDPKRVNPKAVLNHISNAKNQLIGPAEYQQFARDFFSEKVAEIYPRYQKALSANNALDFDDIIMKTVQLFQKFPEVLDQYQEKFKFISVDEYQDTNHAQYVLINLLAAKYRNLVVIGDEDQSIYGWRGANLTNILNFEKDYQEARVIKLEQNYRSTQVILDGAHNIIRKNKQRKEKKLWTNNSGGEMIRHWLADNERHEAQMIAMEVGQLLIGSEYPGYSDFVVLYRTHAQSRVIEEVFMRHGIPYKIVGGIKFYERKEIKDILAYLRLVNNPSDSVSLLRIINTPSRKIGAKTLEALQEFALRHNLSLFNAILLAGEVEGMADSKADVLEEFAKIIKELQGLNGEFCAAGMIKHVLDLTGYKKFIDDGSVEGEVRLENIAEFISVAHKYDELEPGASLNIFLEEVSLITDLDNMDESDNAVTFMTVHGAKGLEFPYVFIAGLEEGIFPHNRSLMDSSELEEERRLMYVAMTRAMEKLYLLHARCRTLYGESRVNAPSQFLADIDENLIEANFGGKSGSNFGGTQKARQHVNVSDIGERPVPVELEDGVEIELDVGDKVSHVTFGNGIVVDRQGGVVTVAFEDSGVGVKKLALSVAPLKKV